MEEMQALPIPTNYNIWSDDISPKDFTSWIKEIRSVMMMNLHSPLRVIQSVSLLVSGNGVASEDNVAVRFGQNRPVNFSSNMTLLYLEAKDFERTHRRRDCTSWLLSNSVHMLRRYKTSRYRQIVQARMAVQQEEKHRFYCFLVSTKHAESASHVLEQLEIQGILRHIHAFAVHKIDRSKIEARFFH